MTQKPVLFDLEETSAAVDVVAAAPVPDLEGAETTASYDQADAPALERLARRPSRLMRWFFSLLAGVFTAVLGIWAWQFAIGLISSVPILGWGIAGAFGVLLVLAVLLGLRELAALVRLGRIDRLRTSAQNVGDDLSMARAVTQQLSQFYAGREDLKWARARFEERSQDVMDADAVLDLAEQELLVPLDQLALAEVEAAARQVATVTALVPLALADVVVALLTSLRMIRRVAEIYGGRSGGLSAWRLTRRVFAHLVATGAMAVGDDLLEPVLGGSLLSKVSRRFGEGLVNGALSARVGLAALDLCRPLPFSTQQRPKTRQVVQNALKGLIQRDS